MKFMQLLRIEYRKGVVQKRKRRGGYATKTNYFSKETNAIRH